MAPQVLLAVVGVFVAVALAMAGLTSWWLAWSAPEQRRQTLVHVRGVGRGLGAAGEGDVRVGRRAFGLGLGAVARPAEHELRADLRAAHLARLLVAQRPPAVAPQPARADPRGLDPLARHRLQRVPPDLFDSPDEHGLRPSRCPRASP